MTSGLALLAHWSVRQKLNRVSSVQLRRSVGRRALTSWERWDCMVSKHLLSLQRWFEGNEKTSDLTKVVVVESSSSSLHH